MIAVQLVLHRWVGVTGFDCNFFFFLLEASIQSNVMFCCCFFHFTENTGSPSSDDEAVLFTHKRPAEISDSFDSDGTPVITRHPSLRSKHNTTSGKIPVAALVHEIVISVTITTVFLFYVFWFISTYGMCE